jgi:predicted ribosomally synthesized peptide with nif11-like leader
MSEIAAQDFVRRVESDEELASELEALKGDSEAIRARARAAGFDADPAEIRAAFLEYHGARLSRDQLDSIAAGAAVDPVDAAVISGGAIGVGGAVAAAAALG